MDVWLVIGASTLLAKSSVIWSMETFSNNNIIMMISLITSIYINP